MLNVLCCGLSVCGVREVARQDKKGRLRTDAKRWRFGVYSMRMQEPGEGVCEFGNSPGRTEPGPAGVG